jgi:hypothetical protein
VLTASGRRRALPPPESTAAQVVAPTVVTRTPSSPRCGVVALGDRGVRCCDKSLRLSTPADASQTFTGRHGRAFLISQLYVPAPSRAAPPPAAAQLAPFILLGS